MLTPAQLQPLQMRPAPLPPSPVRPAGEPLATARESSFRDTRRGDAQPPVPTSAPEARGDGAWRSPVRGDTALAAQQMGQPAAPDLPRQDGAAGDLSEEEKARVADLKARDAEVRAHERAHQAAGGQYAGAASYEMTRGPDGRQYAIGGEVPIDVSPGRTPDETIAKMQQVKAAALAPAEPSGQDRRVAAMADAQRLQAMAEKQAQARAGGEADMPGAASADRRAPAVGGGPEGEGAAVVFLPHGQAPAAAVHRRGLAAYGAVQGLTGTSPYAQRADRFDLVA